MFLEREHSAEPNNTKIYTQTLKQLTHQHRISEEESDWLSDLKSACELRVFSSYINRAACPPAGRTHFKIAICHTSSTHVTTLKNKQSLSGNFLNTQLWNVSMTETETLAAAHCLSHSPCPLAHWRIFINSFTRLQNTHASDISTQSVPAAGECKDYIYTLTAHTNQILIIYFAPATGLD